MISTIISDANPSSFNDGLRTKIQGEVLPVVVPVQNNSTCYCSKECDYYEEVYYTKLWTGEWYQNDKNSFLFQKLVVADTVIIELYKNNILLTLITDNTLGEYYNGFAAQPLYVGFVADWQKISATYGTGLYQIKAQTVIIGVTALFKSQLFRLRNYSDEIADKSVRFEVRQNGNIIGNSLDFTDLNWWWYYRVKGRLIKESPEIEQDHYIASNYEKKQIQDKLIRNWKLETHLIPSHLGNLLTEDNVLANEFLITDYNLMNSEIYRRKSLVVDNIEVNNKNNNRKVQINIGFKDKIDNLVKRNF